MGNFNYRIEWTNQNREDSIEEEFVERILDGSFCNMLRN